MQNNRLLIRIFCLVLSILFVSSCIVACDNSGASNQAQNSANTDTISGKDGADGKDGLNGANGKDGVDGKDGADGKDGINGANGKDGKDGKSAYELAVENGFSGTLQEWLDSLSCDCDGIGSNTDSANQLKELLTLKKELRVNEDGSFKAIVFSDIHCYSANELKASDALKNMNNLIDRENPDIVLFAGDNWWGLSTEEKFRDYIKVLVAHTEEKQIPWAHVYGNHDDEINYGGHYTSIHQSAQQRICEEFEYCVSKWGKEELSGVGNYVLPVFSYDGKSIVYNIWGLDSGSYTNTINAGNITDTFMLNGKTVTNTFYGKYDGIRDNQVEWYVETSKLLEEYNGAKIPAMMYIHIPLQETYTAWKLAMQFGKAGSGKFNMEVKGTKGEMICAPAYNAGLFDEIVERGDVKLVTYGHDHLSDFTVEYRGVNLCHIPAMTTRSDVSHSDELAGGRVIEFSANDPWNLNTYMSYVIEMTEVEPEPPVEVDTTSPILNMVIGDDGSVTNAIEGRPEITSHDFSGSTKTVAKDNDINRNAITFSGGSSTPSVYNIAAANINDLIADGFSYEVMFKITDTSFSSNYVGILDIEEAGGFGLDIYKVSGDSTKALISAEIAYGISDWEKIQYEINLNEWYHCVFSYDGSNITLYFNGVKVGEKAISEYYRYPSFSSRPGEEYICIGACAQAWQASGVKSQGLNGMKGSIAICNIFPDAMTETEAQELYNAIK